MIDSIVLAAKRAHRSVFMRFKRDALGDTHSQIVMPTYERRSTRIEDANEITMAAYFDMMRRRMNEQLSFKAKDISYIFNAIAVAVGCFIVYFMWSTHQPFSESAKERIFSNDKLNAVYRFAPAGVKDRVEAVNSKLKERKENQRTASEARAERRAAEQQAAKNRAQKWKDDL